MNALDRLDQLERTGDPQVGVHVVTAQDPPEPVPLLLDYVAVDRAHLRALLDVARAAERARIDGVITDDGIYIRPNASMAFLWDALAPLLEEQ